MRLSKRELKEGLGRLPLLPEFYWRVVYQGKPQSRKASLQSLREQIPQWKVQARTIASQNSGSQRPKKRIALFSSYKLWLRHSALLAIALACWGHSVTLAYLPYLTWRRKMLSFNLRIQNVYLKDVLAQLAPWVKVVPLYSAKRTFPKPELPSALEQALQEVSLRDTQYTLQIEHFDPADLSSEAGRLYALRMERNCLAAAWAWEWLKKEKPELLLVPNGSILEFGAIYQVAKFLGIPTVTYEFGEQRQRIWLALNEEVMLQNTDSVWQAHASQPFEEEQREKLAALLSARSQADLWENFSRRWQRAQRQGIETVRQQLALAEKPTFLLATNVIGDSLTLNRQIFSHSMTEWIERTLQFFARHPQVQLILRIHPGERHTCGPSVKEIVAATLPVLPEHFRVVGADESTNTYDLIELADVGLVYTTTTGLEMAMSGLPVIVAGKTHYRRRGFTFDPASWEEYFALLERAIADPSSLRLSPDQVERAWHYAYVFFFEYPFPFPWHLHLKDDLEQWPLQKVFSEEGQKLFGLTFSRLCGETTGEANLASG
ncbi:MAG: capsular biosynthesis protein [Anaerolineales bacterium]|nr:capsular biosynthesis protein [Anaerolineales bacterium]MDW8162274.1 hypothetical protein [Anaerolineales bacterium]